jgi:hypothetical protein
MTQEQIKKYFEEDFEKDIAEFNHDVICKMTITTFFKEGEVVKNYQNKELFIVFLFELNIITQIAYMKYCSKFSKLQELLPKFPETLCLNHLVTPLEIIHELIKIAKSEEIELDITEEKISEVEIYIEKYLDDLYKNNEDDYISWFYIKDCLKREPDFNKNIFNRIREEQHKIASLEDFGHKSMYINELRNNFEVPKEIIELLYLENKKEENKIRGTDGGAICSCGAFHWAPPKSNVLVFYTKEYAKDRDLILSNNLFTSPCQKCGKPYLWEKLTYIDLDKKIVVGRYQHFFEFLKNEGYKIYEVEYEPGGLEGYIKIIEELEGIKKPTKRTNEKLVTSTDKSENRLSFENLGLIGKTIEYFDDANIVAEVLGDKEVKFENKVWRLSPLTLEIETRKNRRNQSGAYWGVNKWKYQGRSLEEWMKEIQVDESEIEENELDSNNEN